MCKHLIQDVEHVPPIFFLEVRRHRTTPFEASDLESDSGAESEPEVKELLKLEEKRAHSRRRSTLTLTLSPKSCKTKSSSAMNVC
jgi:hypothetical protein